MRDFVVGRSPDVPRGVLGLTIAVVLSSGCWLKDGGRSPRTAHEAVEETAEGSPSSASSSASSSGSASGTVLADPDRIETHDTRTIPGHVTCFLRLGRLGIAHQSLGAVEGIETPVRVEGEIGGIFYRPLGRSTLVADCRLVLALHRAGPYLRNLGVEEMHFSSAYRRGSRMPSGKLSRHGLGLAIDVHSVRTRDGGGRLAVQDDFERGVEDGCDRSRPMLNRLACILLRQGLFDLVLTPDFDEAHRNHLHIDLEPLTSKRGRRTVPVVDPDVDPESQSD